MLAKVQATFILCGIGEMANVRIRPRLTQQDVVNTLTGLGAILSGRKEDRHGLKDVFFGAMAEHLYRKIHQSFLQKSRGASDDQGESWSRLSKVTMKRRLSKAFAYKYPGSLAKGINRVDDTLLKSVTPGTFDGFRYTPPANQYFKYERGTLTLGSMLSYAEYVHAKRPLWPSDLTPWISESISKAIEATILHIKRQVE